MLIPSPRHRPADLELWRDLEAADFAHADRLMRSGKIERSLEAIRSFAASGPCYASVSWGKDSVAMAHLIRIAAPRVPLLYLRAVPTGNPESEAVRDAYFAAFPGQPAHEAEVDYRQIPRGLGADATEQAKDRMFFAVFRGFGARHLSGIRADESAGRKIRMRRWGLASDNACAPLGWWSEADVFAYLAHHGLPAHPAYAMLGAGRWDRRNLRVDELGGARGDQFGRGAWELEYYGDVLRRLQAGDSTPAA